MLNSKLSLIVLTCLIFISFSALAEEPWFVGKDKSWVDREGFPEAYSILTSENIMYPGLNADRLLKIDSKRQLFVDDSRIATMENLTRQFHRAKKYSSNPLLPGPVSTVMYDESNNKFRLWTISFGYTESSDGVNWEPIKPGTPETAGELRGIMCNPELKGTAKEYQAIVMKRSNVAGDKPVGFYLFHSPDGVNWQLSHDYPVIKDTGAFAMYEDTQFWSMSVGDTTNFRYDPVLKKYIADAKFNLYMPKEKFRELGIIRDDKMRLRLRSFMESDDLVHWTDPRFLMFPDKYDAPDCQIYGHVGFVYESTWIGVARIMHMIPINYKQVDMQLTYSRDGRHWCRPQQRQAFIALGEDPDSWEADYSGLSLSAPLLVNDELWFYYYGSRNAFRENQQGWGAFSTGLAKLRRDGFVSLNARKGDEPGKVTTRPLNFSGKTLFVNAQVQQDGWIKAAVLTKESEPIMNYQLEDAVAMTEDTTKGRMTWKTTDALVIPAGNQHVRLVFEMKNAKLYSFWIE